jgi:hypothetical protein
MSKTSKQDKKTVTVNVDAETQKKLAKSVAALSEVAGAWIEASQSGLARPT